MNIKKLILDLCAYNNEQEWFEFKENWSFLQQKRSRQLLRKNDTSALVRPKLI